MVFCGGKEDDGKTCHHKMMESDGTWWKIMKHDILIEYDEQMMDIWFNMIEKKRWMILNQDGGTSPYALWCSNIHLHDWFLRYMLVNIPYTELMGWGIFIPSWDGKWWEKTESDFRKVRKLGWNLVFQKSSSSSSDHESLHPDAPGTSFPHGCILITRALLKTAWQTMASFGCEVCLNHFCWGFPSYILCVCACLNIEGEMVTNHQIGCCSS